MMVGRTDEKIINLLVGYSDHNQIEYGYKFLNVSNA